MPMGEHFVPVTNIDFLPDSLVNNGLYARETSIDTLCWASPRPGKN